MPDDETSEGIEQDEIVDVELEGELLLEELGRETPSAELVIREEREHLPAPASVLPSSREWEATMAIAREIAGTQFVPESYRGRPEAVVAAILTGREMGIGPMQALRQIHMIDGRPAFAADLMMAKMRAGGVSVLFSSVTDDRAYIKAIRKDTGEEAEVEWTRADAEKAGLLGKKNWRTYPGDMLWARAVGRLARRLGSDLLGGLVYAKEEMEDWDDGGYGGDAGYEATTTRAFDPETDLAPGAPKTREEIAAQFNRFDPTVDWGAVTLELRLLKYGAAELEGDDLKDFYRRLANSVWFIGKDLVGDFPPVSAEKLMEGFAYGFSGATVEIVYKEVEVSDAALSQEQQEQSKQATTDDDPEFGETK